MKYKTWVILGHKILNKYGSILHYAVEIYCPISSKFSFKASAWRGRNRVNFWPKVIGIYNVILEIRGSMEVLT